jgi:hypothetical protein
MQIDVQRFEAAGLGFTQDGDRGVFTCPNDDGTATEVSVNIVDGQLAFYSRRSAGQRAVLTWLGEDAPG